MTDDHAPTQALATRPAAAELLLSDDEIRRTYRIAESLALSGMWKDIRKAEQAFAKMIIGRDLGMTPAQAMQGIHIVEGGIQMHYATLGQFIRSREGYDYRAGWIKEQPRIALDGETEGSTPQQVFVWHDEEDPLDGREVIGAAVVFTVDGVQRGISRYTTEDARAAGLIKSNEKAAWNTARRNMLLARAMSNGVKWFVPEVMGGMPVYTDGELSEKPSLTAGTGSDAGQGVELGPQVEKVIARALELGHRGLSNRAAIELALGNRAPGIVKDWVRRANAELDSFSAQRDLADTVEGEAVEEPPSTEGVPTGPSAPVSPNPDQVVSTAPAAEVEAEVLLRRYQRLAAIDPTTLSEDDAVQLQAELEHVEGELANRGVAVGQ